MVQELSAKLNYAVTQLLIGSTSTLSDAQKESLNTQGGYSSFVVAFNEVTQHLYIGNDSSSFTLLNQRVAEYEHSTSVFVIVMIVSCRQILSIGDFLPI